MLSECCRQHGLKLRQGVVLVKTVKLFQELASIIQVIEKVIDFISLRNSCIKDVIFLKEMPDPSNKLVVCFGDTNAISIFP
jgi:hypothetical protein